MKVLPERSEELQQAIVRNQELLKNLSNRIAEVLKKNGIKLADDYTYVFVPQVYRKPVFRPEIYIASSSLKPFPPIGVAGPLDPQFAVIINNDRIRTVTTKKDPTPEPALPSLRKDILKNPDLFLALSESIAEIFSHHNIKFNTDETFAFIPLVVKRPLFEGQLAADDPVPVTSAHSLVTAVIDNPWAQLQVDSFDWDSVFDPGVIINGIPAPEILVALERQRIGF